MHEIFCFSTFEINVFSLKKLELFSLFHLACETMFVLFSNIYAPQTSHCYPSLQYVVNM